VSRLAIRSFVACVVAASFAGAYSPRAAAQAQVLPRRACDFLDKTQAAQILGVAVEDRSQGLDCWFVQTGWTNKLPNNKAIRFGLVYYPSQRPDDFIDTRKNSREYLPDGGALTEVGDFADAALWLWIRGFGGTLTAFKGGMIQASVNITGLPEDETLRQAKALAAKPLGGAAASGFAYRGWSKPDTRSAASSPAPGAAGSGPVPAPASTPAAPARPTITGTFSDAPYLTTAAFMHDLKEVSLKLVADRALQKWLPVDELQEYVVNALGDRGIDVRPAAPIALLVRMRLFESTFSKYAPDEEDEEDPEDDPEAQRTEEILVSFDFLTRAAVRRHGAFHVLNVAVARDDTIASVIEGNLIRRAVFGDERLADMREALPRGINDLLKDMERTTGIDPAPWYAEKWTDEQKAAANAAFIVAMRQQTPPGKRFDDVDSEPVYNFSLPAQDDTCKGRPRDWRNAYRLAFHDLGWVKAAADVESPLRLDHTLWCDLVDTFNTPKYYRIMNIMEIDESNAVFAFDGKIVRKTVTLVARTDVAKPGLADGLDDAMEWITDLIDHAPKDIDKAQN
jgi:hypothetical protein